MRRNQTLRDFLRSRRALITPEQAGVRQGPGRRRVPGLRREELAELAGISVDYYVRFEQGRGPNVSDAVLDSIARVLKLTASEREYLHDIARGQGRVAPRPRRSAGVAVRSLLSTVTAPAFALGRGVDLLAVNEPARRLFQGLERSGNYARWLLLDPNSQFACEEWMVATREAIAMLRRDAGRHPHDGDLLALIEELTAGSEVFQHLWARHEVDVSAGTARVFRRSSGQEIVLEQARLAVSEDPDQTVFVFLHAADVRAARAVHESVSEFRDQSEAPVPAGCANGHR